MAVPDYQSLMLPLLRLAADGKDHALRDAIEKLAEQFRLSPEDREEMLPSGTQRKFDNRVGWARTYMQKAGLLDRPRRGYLRITERGRDVLLTEPERIDVDFLKQYPEFLAFQTASRPEPLETAASTKQTDQTPEELLESSYQELRDNLAQKLLEKTKNCSPEFFEQLVVDLLVAMGYGGSRKDAGKSVGRTGDGGVDGVINEDRLGLDVIYVQAKRWKGTVGRPVVQTFAGSLEGYRARKGVLITTSRFSDDALEYVRQIERKIVLIDGQRLTQLMIDHGVGVTEDRTFAVKRMDSDYFEME